MSTRRIAYAAVLAALYIVIGQFVRIPAATIFSIGLAAEAVVDIVVIVLAVPLLRPLVREAAPA